MFEMCYKIKIGKYSLKILDSVKITKSIENLVDTAVIVLPDNSMSADFNFEGINEGDRVEIQLGYGENGLRTEFTGYLSNIATDDASIKLECEDGFYMLKKTLELKSEFKNINTKKLLDMVIKQINSLYNTNYILICDYEYCLEKFIILPHDTGFDVLKKIQEEIRANIYFIGNALYVHPPYSEIVYIKSVIFDFSVNIEKFDLKYVKADDKKIEVEVSAINKDGTLKKESYGRSGGKKIKKFIHLTNTDPDEDKDKMQSVAKAEYKIWIQDGYEGSITGWLIPYVEPKYTIYLHDSAYPNKNVDVHNNENCYYVTGTETNFSSDGGVRTIKLIKLWKQEETKNNFYVLR